VVAARAGRLSLFCRRRQVDWFQRIHQDDEEI
jgi:hypothetical protein